MGQPFHLINASVAESVDASGLEPDGVPLTRENTPCEFDPRRW